MSVTPEEPPVEITPADQPPPASVTRDAAYWAKAVSHLHVDEVPAGAMNLNVTGRRVTSPIQGFGKMWQKTYRIRLTNVDIGPEDVIREWKAHFGEFWPRKNWFYGSLSGIAPGDVALLNLRMGGMNVSTGVLVLYADDVSFTVMTPQGHQFSGFNTFSARREDGATVIDIQALVRGSDPIYEVALAAQFGHWMEDRFWRHTMRALAAHVGSAEQAVELQRVCVDKRRQWRNAKNIWYNAVIRSVLYTAAAPARWIAKPLQRRPAGTP